MSVERLSRRLMALFAFVMIAMTPFTATTALAAADDWKIGSSNYATLEDAVNAVSNGGTIVMQRDVAVSATIDIVSNKTCTIDFNGHKLSMSAAGSGTLLIIRGGGKITLKNGNLVTSTSAALDVSGSQTVVNILSGDYSANDDAVYTFSGTIIITSGRFRATTGGDGAIRAAGSGTIKCADGSGANVANWYGVNDVTVKPFEWKTGGVSYTSLEAAVAAVGNNGTIEMLRDVVLTPETVVVLAADKTYTIDFGGYTLSMTASTDNYTINMLLINKGNVTLQNGTMSAPYTGQIALFVNSGATAKIMSGNYTGAYQAVHGNGQTVIVTGRFRSTTQRALAGDKLSIWEGSTANPESWQAASAKDVTVTEIPPAFKIGDKLYPTLGLAAADVWDGDIIEMIRDVRLTYTTKLDVDMEYTINFGGYTLSSEQSVLDISRGTVTLKNGNVRADTYYGIYVTERAKVYILSGDYSADQNAVYSYSSYYYNPLVVITSGNFHQTGSGNGALRGSGISLADGSTATPEPWTGIKDVTVTATPILKIGAKQYISFEDAAADVQDGETIEMLCNVTLVQLAQLNADKTYTLDLGGYTLSGGSSIYLLRIAAGNVTLKNGVLQSSRYFAVYVSSGAVVNILSGEYSAGNYAVGSPGVVGSRKVIITSGRFYVTPENRNGAFYGSGISLFPGSTASVNRWNEEGVYDVTITAPSLYNGTLNRTSDVAATIGFTTDEAGTAYYLVQNSGAAAPTGEQVKAGTSLGAVAAGTVTDKAVTLTAEAKDIYIVVEDAESNISNLMKIEIPVWKTGSIFYNELTDAVAAVGSGGTIEMLSDVALSATAELAAAKTYTLDFGGHTLSGSSMSYVLNIAGGNVTLQNSRLQTSNAWNNHCVAVNSGATVNILSGDYSAYDDAVICINGTAIITAGHFLERRSDGDGAIFRRVAGGISNSISLAAGSVADVENWLSYTGNPGAKEVTITSGAPPILSNGTVNRTSDAAATIGFTTDKAGTAYYLVQNSGASAPTGEQVKAGTSLGSVAAGTVTGKSVTLTAGAQDIYIVVEDAISNISNLLKIEVAAAAGSYTSLAAWYAADPSALTYNGSGSYTLNGASTLDNLTIAVGETLAAEQYRVLTIAGTFTVNGELTIGGQLFIEDGGSLTGTGSIISTRSSGYPVLFNGGGTCDVDISGGGTVYKDGGGTLALSGSNDINITVAQGTVAITGNYTIPAGTTLSVSNGATLTVNSGATLTNNGGINPAAGCTVNINGTYSGDIGSGNNTLNIGSAGSVNGNLSLGGPSSLVTIAAGGTVTGTITVYNGTLNAAGNLSSDLTVSGGAVTIAGTHSGARNFTGGTVSINGTQVYPGPETIVYPDGVSLRTVSVSFVSYPNAVAPSDAANTNHVTVNNTSSVTEPDFVFGGYNTAGSSTGNTTILNSGATVSTAVYGGFATNGGDATGNTVTVNSGSSVRIVYGGWAEGAGSAASGNTVILNTGAAVGANVYGGVLASSTGVTADNNTIVIHSGVAVGGHVYGGMKVWDPIGTGNKLELIGSGQTIGRDLEGFQILDFSLPSDLTNGGTILTVGNDADITGATVNIGGSGLSLSAGYTVVLIDASTGTLTGTPANSTVSGGGYSWNLSVSGNQLIATVSGTLPILSNGTVTRTSDVAATIGFTTDKAGTAYYLVQNSGATAPTGVQVKARTSLGLVAAGTVTGKTVMLTAEAVDIYVVVEDAANNLSDPLKIEVPEYVPLFKIGSAEYPTLEAAVAAVQNGQTIEMMRDVTLTATVILNVTKTYTIDFGGYTLSSNSDILTVSFGIVTLQNGTVQTSGNRAIYLHNNIGTRVNILSGDYSAYDDVVYCSGGSSVVIIAGHFLETRTGGADGAIQGSSSVTLAATSTANVANWKNGASDVTITAGAPTLTLISANRTSDVAATVVFTSNEDGTIYYLVQNSGAAAPTGAQVKAGTSLGSVTAETVTSKAVMLTAGAKDIYIVVENAASNISNLLKIEVSGDVGSETIVYPGVSLQSTYINYGYSNIVAPSDAANASHVTVNNTSAVTDPEYVFGGYNTAGTSTGNTVILNSGATVSTTVYGGFATNGGDATGNTVTLNSGSSIPDVRGGYAISGGDATGNTVTVNSGSSVLGVYGGYAAGAGSNASGNTVILNTGTVAQNVFGGLLSYSSGVTADNNTVVLHSGVMVDGGVYGGMKVWDPIGTGNKLELIGSGQNVGGDFKGFQILDFSLPSDLTNGGTILTVGINADITDATVNIGGSGLSLGAGNTVVLIDASAGTLTGAPANTTVSGGGYNWKLSVLNNQLIATVAGPILSNGTVNRTSDAAATIGFDTDDAGTAYYLVQNSGATAPTVAQVKAGTSLGSVTAGTVTGKAVTLTAGAKDIYIVVEDAASNISNLLKIEVAHDITPPALSAGTVNRTSNTAATIGFTTDDAGTAYYLVQNSGATAPTGAQVKGGTSLGSVAAGTVTGRSVTLTAGAKDIYIVVEDAASNISNLLKIEVAAYSETIVYPGVSLRFVSIKGVGFSNVVAPSDAANANHVTVNNTSAVTDPDFVFGGYNTAGASTGNTTILNSGATVNYSVFGGFATNGGDASGNTVTLNAGSSVTNVYGGRTEDAGNASGNTVIIKTGATVNGIVYGGLLDSPTGITADNNTVTLHSGVTVGFDVCGGTKFGLIPVGTGNKLELIGSGQTVGEILNGFQILDFSLPSDLTNGGTILTVGQDADITGATVNIGGSGLSLGAGNTVVLIDASAGTLTGAPANSAVSGGGYNWKLSVSNNRLIATVAGPILSNGTVNRTGDAAATIGFDTDDAGTAYYLVQNSGATAPTVAQVKAGTSLGAVAAGTVTGKAVTLTAGAKDIYVVVEDAASNISNLLKIEVPAYVTYSVNIGTFAGGTVSADKTVNIAANETVTLTITPDAGFELDAITVYRTDAPGTVVETLRATSLQYTFTMPAYDVTVTATFRNPDAEAITEAKGLIEAMSNVIVAQATANTEADVKTWLATQINALSGMSATGIMVTEANITLSGFNAAVAGTSGTPAGTNGSFTFTVSLAKGSSNVTTASKAGTITATEAPFVAVTGITGIPTTVTAGTPLTLSGTVAPTDATNQTIIWSVKTAGTTGANISGDILNTSVAGTVVVTATIVNGTAAGVDYIQDFSVTVNRVMSDAAELESIMVNGVQLNLDNLVYLTECGVNSITLNTVISQYATLKVNGSPYNNGEAILLHSNETEINIQVISESGIINPRTYTLRVTMPLSDSRLYYSRWDNVLAVNRNPVNNGGYNISAVRWYRNDVQFSTAEFIKITGNKTDYFAEIETGGVWYKVCQSSETRSLSKILAYPNPVSFGESLTLQIPEEYMGGKLDIYSLSGALIKSGIQLSATIFSLNVSEHVSASGIYLFRFTSKTTTTTVKVIVN